MAKTKASPKPPEPAGWRPRLNDPAPVSGPGSRPTTPWVWAATEDDLYPARYTVAASPPGVSRHVHPTAAGGDVVCHTRSVHVSRFGTVVITSVDCPADGPALLDWRVALDAGVMVDVMRGTYPRVAGPGLWDPSRSPLVGLSRIQWMLGGLVATHFTRDAGSEGPDCRCVRSFVDVWEYVNHVAVIHTPDGVDLRDPSSW